MKSLVWFSIFLVLGIALALISVNAMEDQKKFKLHVKDYYDKNKRRKFLKSLKKYYEMILKISKTIIIRERPLSIVDNVRLELNPDWHRIEANGGLVLVYDQCGEFCFNTPLGRLEVFEETGTTLGYLNHGCSEPEKEKKILTDFFCFKKVFSKENNFFITKLPLDKYTIFFPKAKIPKKESFIDWDFSGNGEEENDSKRTCSEKFLNISREDALELWKEVNPNTKQDKKHTKQDSRQEIIDWAKEIKKVLELLSKDRQKSKRSNLSKS